MSFHKVLLYPNAFDRLHCHLQRATNTKQYTIAATFNFILYAKLKVLSTHKKTIKTKNLWKDN